jgi:putative serine protease PepD
MAHTMNPNENGSIPELPTIPVAPAMEIGDVAPPLAVAITAGPVGSSAKPAAARRFGDAMWNWVLPSMFLIPLLMLLIYAIPYLLLHWRLMEAHAEAESTYMKRRAELKAEAEHADARLDLLDKRVHFTSLGFREVVRKVTPNVVNVVSFREPTKEELAKFGKKSLVFDSDNDRQYLQLGVGSGLIIKPGVILTNNHVVKGAERLRISFASGQSIGVSPEAVVADAMTDLAVVRLPSELPAGLKEEAQQSAVFADSDKDVQVGDWALAIGSPLGLKQTVTQGVISAKGRLLHLLDMVELLQTDAAINPGNSGGSMTNCSGDLVGVPSAGATVPNEAGQASSGSVGIGFAIPSNLAQMVSNEIISTGTVTHAYFGMSAAPIPPAVAKRAGTSPGLFVVSVTPGGPAQQAGLQEGDIITEINGQPATDTNQLYALTLTQRAGDTVSITYERDGHSTETKITLGSEPGVASSSP